MPSTRTRLKAAAALFALGALGIVALLLDGLSNPGQYEELAAEAGIATELLLVAAGVQSATFLAVAVLVGVFTAPKLGFTSRVYDRITEGASLREPLRADLGPGLAGGVAVGGMLLAVEVVAGRVLELGGPEMTTELLVSSVPLRLFYGGITEELLLRWGVMSLLAFVLWRLAGDARGEPSAAIAWTAIVVSAVAFGVLHLPAAAGIYGALTPEIVAFIVGANTVGGVVFGWLFWRHSLEAAMVAHAGAHVLAVSVWLTLLLL